MSVNGKGGKEVWRPIHPLVWEEAQKYPREGLWFPSPYTNSHVAGHNVSQVISKALKRAGITGHTAHNLRAWYATELAKAGISTAVIAAGLRHSDLQSVTRYVTIPEEAIATAQAQLPSIHVPNQTIRKLAA